MDKLQKHDYMNQIEEYLETNQVYELFEDLLKQLVVKRPEKPLDFIMQALQNPQRKCSTKLTHCVSPQNILARSARMQ